MTRPIQLGVALALLTIAAIGTWHSVRAARAQILYFKSKYGADRHSLDRILSNSDTAHRLYPYNYRLCTWAAEAAWYSRYIAGDGELAVRAEAARLWADRGRELNAYVRELNLVKARYQADHAIEDAIETWRSYLDIDFWDSFNHAVMVELYSRAGRFEEAVAELAWVREPGDRDYAQQAIYKAFDAEVRKLQGD